VFCVVGIGGIFGVEVLCVLRFRCWGHFRCFCFAFWVFCVLKVLGVFLFRVLRSGCWGRFGCVGLVAFNC
jgi:hypothetical protein